MTEETIDDLLSELSSLAFDRDPDCPMIPYDYREKFYEAVRSWLTAKVGLDRLVAQRDAAIAVFRKLDQLDWCIGYELGGEDNHKILDAAQTLALVALAEIEEDR